MASQEDGTQECRSLEALSLGGVAAMTPQTQLPKKYKKPGNGEVSTYAGAGVVPVTRTADGEARILLWQPQSGNKKGVRWFDFGGRKEQQVEYTSVCACRKFAKQTYGVFGCELFLQGSAAEHLAELYQGLANLPLMLRSGQEWAKMQMLADDSKIFYSDIHEYHAYLLMVPYVDAEILNKVSELVDGGKRVFRWLNKKDLDDEVLAPRLHTAAFMEQIATLQDDEWIKQPTTYGDGVLKPATGSFMGVTHKESAKKAEESAEKASDS